jgi:hypothetical protein
MTSLDARGSFMTEALAYPSSRGRNELAPGLV